MITRRPLVAGTLAGLGLPLAAGAQSARKIKNAPRRIPPSLLARADHVID